MMNEDIEHTDSNNPPTGGIFASHEGLMAVVGILVARLGGKVTLTQEDFNILAGQMIHEDSDFLAGSIQLELRLNPEIKTQ